ncbi:hypothetical protein JC776_21440 (plasmid) [Bacillus cytotoxicus]|uniref:hypothetical protein n=1 Tax=Bacillus cytotoxicus TaxID=580165 RepID=UPI001AED1E71|nr:hypothetical protein [Bacillus cytotoxicus]QTR69181.1 hypothetical protein JC776_21440 [Bacillus cytotoxicus]
MRSVEFKGFSEYDQRSLFEIRLNNDFEARKFTGAFNDLRGEDYKFVVEAYEDKYAKCLVKVVFSSQAMSEKSVKIGIDNILNAM